MAQVILAIFSTAAVIQVAYSQALSISDTGTAGTNSIAGIEITVTPPGGTTYVSGSLTTEAYIYPMDSTKVQNNAGLSGNVEGIQFTGLKSGTFYYMTVTGGSMTITGGTPATATTPTPLTAAYLTELPQTLTTSSMTVLRKNGTDTELCVMWNVDKDITNYNRIYITIREEVTSGSPNTESEYMEIPCEQEAGIKCIDVSSFASADTFTVRMYAQTYISPNMGEDSNTVTSSVMNFDDMMIEIMVEEVEDSCDYDEMNGYWMCKVKIEADALPGSLDNYLVYSYEFNTDTLVADGYETGEVSDDDMMCDYSTDGTKRTCYFWVKGMVADVDYGVTLTQVCADDDEDGDCVMFGDMYTFTITAASTPAKAMGLVFMALISIITKNIF